MEIEPDEVNNFIQCPISCKDIKIARRPYELIWSYKCDGPVISVASTPNCSLIAAASASGKLYLLNRDGKRLWAEPLDKDGDVEAWAVSISADGSRIAVGTAKTKPIDGRVYVFNRKGEEVFNCRIEAPVWGISLLITGKFWLRQVGIIKSIDFMER